MDFGRVITAMITPMNADGSVNYEQAQQLAAHLLKNGSDALVVSGSTGESPTLCADEKLKLYAAVREVTQPAQKMLIAGTGSNDTAASIELSKKAEALGVDAILAVVPPYNKPPQEGLYQHFKAIAEAVSLPILLYNVPGRTVTNLQPDTVARLAKIDNIVGIKDASGDMNQISYLRRLTPPEFMIYSGEDSVTLPMLSLGACGVVSVASHLVGNEIREMIIAFEKGQNEQALELHRRYFPAFKDLFVCANPIPLKYAMGRVGLPAGPCRLPLCGIDEKSKAVVDAMLKEVGLL